MWRNQGKWASSTRDTQLNSLLGTKTTLRGDEEDDGDEVEHKRGTLTIVAWEVTTTHLFLLHQFIFLASFPFPAELK